MTTFSNLTAAEQTFALRVQSDLYNNRDAAQVAVYGDETSIPEGWRFAAAREGASWRVCFDFRKGYCYNTAVQLPADWAVAQ